MFEGLPGLPLELGLEIRLMTRQAATWLTATILLLATIGAAAADDTTVWAQHKWLVVAAVALFMVQAAFIVALLVNRRRLRREHAERVHAEQAEHGLSGRLINAAEEERSRLARELHDDVTQRLALLAIDAGREERNSASVGGSMAMRTVREGLVRLSEDVHALSHQLHPSILEDLGLIDALRAECDRFSQKCSIRVELKTEQVPDRVPPDAALCMFRIAQESLRNVQRHAKASRAEVRLRRMDGGLQLVVHDDGTGFDPSRRRNGTSLGHASMRQRVFLLGGKVEIDSSPGRGTTIRAWVPLREANRAPLTAEPAPSRLH